MDLSLIFTIPGKPGLYKLVSQGKSNAIVESLSDGKKMPMFNLNQVSSLAEIAIYTTEKEVELAEVFRSIYKEEDGKQTLNHKEDFKKIKELFEKVLPNYDTERVYESNIRKVCQWYNILQAKGLIDLEIPEEETEDAPKEEKAPEKGAEAENVEAKPAATKKAAPKTAAKKVAKQVEAKAPKATTTKPAAAKRATTVRKSGK